MPDPARDHVVSWWNEAWRSGLWAASWEKSIADLSAAQAAWSPATPGVPGTRHSIWQIVLHMCFWREGWLRRVATGQKLTPEEISRGNFPPVTDTSEPAWAETRRRFAETQTRFAAALADPAADTASLAYFLPHDCYHFGQINYLRAMQGLKPIE